LTGATDIEQVAGRYLLILAGRLFRSGAAEPGETGRKGRNRATPGQRRTNRHRQYQSPGIASIGPSTGSGCIRERRAVPLSYMGCCW
jgi:hypothetical protein